MGVSVLIQSTLRNEYTTLEGVSITKALRSVPSAGIRTVDPAGSFLPATGNQVEIQDDLNGPTVSLFGGSIESVERERRNSNIAMLTTVCECLGHAQRLEKRNAGEYYYNGQTGGAILRDVVTNSLSGDISDGSPSTIADGPVLASFAIDYATCREVVEAVCNLTQYEYYVLPDGTLSYFSPQSNACPVSITTGANVKRLKTRETREDLCNRVTVRVGNSLRDPDTQTFIGDSTTKSFSTTYPIAKAPEIFIGSPSVAQTVGIRDVDTGKDWYWQDGSTEITQDDGASAIGTGINIDVVYVGVQSVIVAASNDASIAARAAAENNSGIYHKYLTLDERLTRADAQAIADSYVDRFSGLSVVLTFETDSMLEPNIIDVEPGQVLTVSLTGWNAAGAYLVRSVNMQMRGNEYDQDRWQVRVEAVSGPILRNYIDVFRDMSSSGGSVSGSGVAAGGSGGAGTYVYEPAKLVANTTITTPIPATSGATMVVFVKQGASSYTISFDAAQFAQVVNTNIPAVEDTEIAFPFVGRSDGLWWPMSFARVAE